MSFDGMERTVCDYIAGMTDHYAVDKYTEIFIPTGWNVRG
jgi:dGTPase